MKLNACSLLAALLLVSGAALAADKPVAKVNGTVIPATFSDALIDEQVMQGAKVDDALKKAARDELIRREVIAQAARKKGYDKKPEVASRMELARQSVLVGYYIDEWVRANPISDETLKTEYDRRVKEMTDLEYKTRHILVEKEDTAKAIITKLQTGAKFEDLAKDSTDTGSKEKGGDLGWSMAQNFVPPFAEALTKLAKGKFTTQPVQTQFGYHVILMEDSRKPEPPAFEEVKAQLQQGMQQQGITKMLGEMLKQAKVE
ncbi:MAG: peptidylprolyl isomerase [Uliginosibacterium sp.]|jgi:peptidyl-prolyl cis-trans isomerase C|nr:peptidylprolyl isomerase [Uliginosibacterium sp.]MBK9393010.1 peptidylprolyl isomerase [Uliginosibacterium sp.]MBK9615685.1 peptidylprolyl isomerase [Uliginosibacterium sp.]